MKIAFVFSGQGSQYKGMAKELYNDIPSSKEVLDKANELLDFDIKELMFNGEEDKLNTTEFTQPAILITSIMALKAIEKYAKAEVVAGLSLGEYSALIASGAMNLEDGVKLIRKRGKIMQEAVPLGVGSMVAIIGLSVDKVKEAINEIKNIGIVEIANYNTNKQIVIAGERIAVEKAKEICVQLGARRAINLNVSGPFHTSLLEEASNKLKEELERINFNNPRIKIISNVNADYIYRKEDIVDILCSQIKSSVRWSETIEKMLELGIDTFIELGPGRVLSGFIREIIKDKGMKVNIFNVEDSKSLKKTIEGIGKLDD